MLPMHPTEYLESSLMPLSVAANSLSDSFTLLHPCYTNLSYSRSSATNLTKQML